MVGSTGKKPKGAAGKKGKGLPSFLKSLPESVEHSELIQQIMCVLDEMQGRAADVRQEANKELKKLLKRYESSYHGLEKKVASISDEAKKQAQTGVIHLLQKWHEHKDILPPAVSKEVEKVISQVAQKAMEKKAKPKSAAKKAPSAARAKTKTSAAAKKKRTAGVKKTAAGKKATAGKKTSASKKAAATKKSAANKKAATSAKSVGVATSSNISRS